jgi:two-component system NtrC family sensor kinase
LNNQSLLRAQQTLDNRLRLLEEHTAKILHSTELALDFAVTLTADLTDEQIRAREHELHDALKRIVEKVPGTQSIWVLGRDGVALASSLLSPAPPVETSDRDYYQAMKTSDPGVYISAVYASRVNVRPFFSMDARRPSADGGFNGVIDAGVLPTDIERYYDALDESGHEYFAMVRRDGAVLARHPRPTTPLLVLPQDSSLLQAMAVSPGGGSLTAGSLDGVERIQQFRPIPGYPVFLVAGLATSAIRAEWLSALGWYLLIAVPAEIALLLALGFAMRRTHGYYEEAERRQKAELALSRGQRLEAVGQLTGSVAHDFNNLLTVVAGAAETAGRHIDNPQRVSRSLELISSAVDRGAALTRQLLSFAGRKSLKAEAVDVREQVLGFEKIIRQTMPENVEVVVKTPPNPCVVNVDPDELDLALLNIAINARDAMPQGGRFTIGVRRVTLDGGEKAAGLVGDFVAISLTDTGSGIDPEDLPRVFEPFFTTKDVGKGTGLGLSQVYGFARQSGGAATIDSTPGRGTTVTIYLPAAGGQPTAASKN